jgi:predicted acyl esterase
LGPIPAALAESAPDAGRPFTVEVNSEPLYGIKAPSEDPATQTVRLQTDGAELFLETYLPAPKDGHVPPERMPTILIPTPYDLANDNNNGGKASPLTLDAVVPHGYAYSQLHLRGTGLSTGCPNLFTRQEANDIARAIEYLGTEAPWSNGVVGGYGHSNPGGSILNAATRADDADTRVTPYLKALWVGAPVVDVYNSNWIIDGVGSQLWMPVGTPYYSIASPLVDDGEDTGTYAERRPCSSDKVYPWLQQSNDYAPYFQDHHVRGSISNLDVPIFMFHGHADLYAAAGASPMNQVGLFEQIPPTTPKFGMFGVYGHDHPSETEATARTVRPEWARPDYDDMRIAWFDYWLKGIDSNIEQWPTVQVQGTDGQWRGEPDWPFTGGPVGQLALGPNGLLGTTDPTGDTTYLEATTETTQGRAPGTFAVFEMDVPERLEITAQPVLDLWVELGAPDGHIAARLETFDREGEPIPYGMTYGMRSVQHLEPLVNNRFVQETGIPAPVGTAVNVPLRLQPTDLVVPAGGSIRLTIAGSINVSPGLNMAGVPDPLLGDWSQVSGVIAPVKILHDCAHPSALRFLMPRSDPDLLNVRERDETHVRANPGPAPVSDGGGIATAPVCGNAPLRLANFGPEIDYRGPAGGITRSPR